jgi:hypothetical protein
MKKFAFKVKLYLPKATGFEGEEAEKYEFHFSA